MGGSLGTCGTLEEAWRDMSVYEDTWDMGNMERSLGTWGHT